MSLNRYADNSATPNLAHPRTPRAAGRRGQTKRGLFRGGDKLAGSLANSWGCVHWRSLTTQHPPPPQCISWEPLGGISTRFVTKRLCHKSGRTPRAMSHLVHRRVGKHIFATHRKTSIDTEDFFVISCS
ncbi:hypothetical protein J6590_001556 [Homalodisca vitripennis]|nr:hypothetical protein J6590_001556 [Homalodisca vitripennis]